MRKFLTDLLILPIRFYRGYISPLTPPSCRFVPTCSQYAIEALKITASNAEALNLKIEAENNLCPTLTINVYVEGKKVNAVIRALKTEPDRSTLPWRLQKGKDYAFEVFYRDSQGRYTGEIPEFSCKQNGLHFKNITLKKMIFSKNEN